MKNKKNVIMAVAILVAVVTLGVGYAAITRNLSINGTATAKTTNEFKVVYDGVNENSTTDTAEGTNAVATAEDDATTGTCEVTLATVGEKATCTYEFKNKSPNGINAVINDANLVVYSEYTDKDNNEAWSATSDDYFDVEVTSDTWDGEHTMNVGDTETFTITVTLKKAYVGDDANPTHTKTFYVDLANITAAQA